jgi:hypothetical protein
MLLPSPRIVSIPIPSPDLRGPMRLDCTHCRGDLSLHLPAPERPLRMLATCEACGCWFLIDTMSDTTIAVMVQLPDPASILAAIVN